MFESAASALALTVQPLLEGPQHTGARESRCRGLRRRDSCKRAIVRRWREWMREAVKTVVTEVKSLGQAQGNHTSEPAIWLKLASPTFADLGIAPRLRGREGGPEPQSLRYEVTSMGP